MHGLVFVGRSRRASASLPGGSTGHSGVTRLGKGCRLSWKRRPEVHPRRRRPSSVQNQPFLGVFSATQPHKGSRIIETYGAGDGNRTQRPSPLTYCILNVSSSSLGPLGTKK